MEPRGLTMVIPASNEEVRLSTDTAEPTA